MLIYVYEWRYSQCVISREVSDQIYAPVA